MAEKRGKASEVHGGEESEGEVVGEAFPRSRTYCGTSRRVFITALQTPQFPSSTVRPSRAYGRRHLRKDF